MYLLGISHVGLQMNTVDGQNPAPPRMMIIPLLIGVSYMSGGCLGFLPSTVLYTYTDCLMFGKGKTYSPSGGLMLMNPMVECKNHLKPIQAHRDACNGLLESPYDWF